MPKPRTSQPPRPAAPASAARPDTGAAPRRTLSAPASAQASPGLLAALAVLLTALVYARVAGFGFIHLDDPLYITENPHVLAGLSLDSLRWALGFNEANYWQPLTWLSLLLDSTLYGDWAGGYHLTNLALHCANVALLFFLALRWFGLFRPQQGQAAKWAALGVALAFGLHPAHVESVAWVTERKDVLFVLFGLLALRSYTGYAERRAAGQPASLLLALGFYALSLLAKPMLVTLPALLVLLDVWPLRRLGPGAQAGEAKRTPLGPLLQEKALFLVLAVALTLTTLLTHPKAYGPDELSLGLKLANAVASYLDYLRLLFFPAGLALVYPYPQAVPAAKLAAAIALLLAVTGAALWQLSRRPQLAVCWLWFLGTLAPVLMPPKVGLHVAHADRWLYFPAIGIYLGLALLVWEGLARLADKRTGQNLGTRLGAGLLLGLCLTLGALSTLQLGWWKDGMTVYERALAVTDDNYFVMNNYGVHKMRAGDFQAAEKWMRRSLALRPNYSEALGNLGILYTNTGRYELALPFFAKALALETQAPDAMAEDHYCAGLCLSRLGRYDEAEPHYQEALRLKPDYSQAHNDLGNIAGLRGRLDLAEAHYAKALEINPSYDVARENLARVRAMRAATGKSPAQSP